MGLPFDFGLGVTASVVANVIGGLPSDQEGKLQSEFEKAHKIASAKFASNCPDYFCESSQVEHFLQPDSETFQVFSSALALNNTPDKEYLARLVRERMEASGNVGQSTEDVIPLFQASNETLADLFCQYLGLLSEEIRRMPRLSSYYHLLVCEHLKDHVAYLSEGLDDHSADHREIINLIRNLIVKTDGLRLLRPVTVADTQILKSYPVDKQEQMARRFFEGRDPSWSDIVTGFGIPRINFRTRINDLIATSVGAQAILVNAVAGAGKSTELMRVAWELAQEDRFTVFKGRFLDSDVTVLSADIEKIVASATGKVPVIVIDGAAATLETWRDVAREFRNSDIIWLVCDRTERWVDALGHEIRKTVPNELGVDTVLQVPLLPLNTEEINALIDHLLSWNILAESMPREVWAARFREKYQGQILVTLLEIQSEPGKEQFKEKLVREARDFGTSIAVVGNNPTALRHLYPAVAAMHRFGIAPQRAWVRNWLEAAGSTDLFANDEAIASAINADILIPVGDDRLQCRHEVIAEVIVHELLLDTGKTGATGLFETYQTWIRCTDTAVSNQSLELKTLFNLSIHRRKLWSIRRRLDLYAELRDHFAGDFIAESAAAYCAIKSGRVDLAKQWHDERGGINRNITQYLAAEALRRGDAGQAAQAYRQALGCSSDSTDEDVVSILEGRSSHDQALLSEWAGFLKGKQKRLDLAERVFRILIKSGLADGLVYRELIWTLHKRSATRKHVEQLLSEAMAAFPDSIPFFVMLHADLTPAKRHSILYDAIREGKADAVVHLEFIRSLPHGTSPDTISDYYRQASRHFPTDAHLYQAYALFLDKRQRYPEAEAQFQAGIAADPTNAPLYQAYALFLDKRQRYPEAEAQFHAGIAADPTNAPLYQAYALFLDKRQRYPEAEAQFQAGIAADPTNAHLWADLASFYYKHGYRRCAANCVRDILLKERIDPPLTQTIGRIFWGLRHYDEAIAVLKNGWHTLYSFKGTKREKARMWAAQGHKLAIYLAIKGEYHEANEFVQLAQKEAPADDLLKELERHLNDPDYRFPVVPLGKFDARDQTGSIRQVTEGRPIFICLPGRAKGVYADRRKCMHLPEEVLALGVPLIFDVWQLSDSKTYALNIEPVEWEWRGVGNLLLSRITIMGKMIMKQK